MPDTPIPPALAKLLAQYLPGPWKAATGIVVGLTEDLPTKLSSLPQSVAGAVVRRSMEAQQQYAEWVAKGEEFLVSLREPEDDAPEWATFDEDEPVTPPAGRTAAPAEADELSYDEMLADPTLDDPLTDDEAGGLLAEPPEVVTPAPVKKSAPAKKATPAAKKKAPAKKTARKAPAARSAAKKTPAKKAPAAAKKTAKKAPGPVTALLDPQLGDAEPATVTPRRRRPAAQSNRGSGPGAMPEFDTLSIPQLRARLRSLKVADLEELVAYERDHRDRQPVIELLSARLETLSS